MKLVAQNRVAAILQNEIYDVRVDFILEDVAERGPEADVPLVHLSVG